MAEPTPSYTEARLRPLTPLGALRAVLNYATDFIARGDIDVLFTLSGGAIVPGDGRSADPAVWADWLDAWRSVSPEEDASDDEAESVDAQHGYRALMVFLERYYQPIDTTPMSHVRDDCVAALAGGSDGAAIRDRWQEALVLGEKADISFRLMKP
jgi:hypothetical protein